MDRVKKIMSEEAIRGFMQPTKEVYYYEDGKVSSEAYYLNSELHKEDGPAVINYYKNGKVSSEYYYLNGKRHREDGPAVINYYEDGKVSSEYYYLNGRNLSKEKFEEIKWNKAFGKEVEEELR